MAERWRRCEGCRKIKPVDDFAGAEPECQACQTPVAADKAVTGRARASAVTTTRIPVGVGGSVGLITGTPQRDLRGRGDPEVRARRARVRALDRLAERFAEDFDLLLAEERRAEGL